MKQNRKRRIPAAALVAAVLVAVLAGTALAREYFGHITVVPQYGGSDGGDASAYSLYGEYDRIPADRLSEDVMSLGAEAGDPGLVTKSFGSWSECEAFLGLELADNSKLDQLRRNASLILDNDSPKAANAVQISYFGQLPYTISIFSSYEGDGFSLIETALLRTEYNDPSSSADMQLDLQAGADFEEYVTPSGMAVTIAAESRSDGNGRYLAHFVRNNAIFTLDLCFGEDQSGDAMLETLKEILDAYE